VRQSGSLIATLPDTLCRFLTAGDVDGDGTKEMVASTHKGGLWLLRCGRDAGAPWSAEVIARDSTGFEHAACLADLDGDRVDELYVANDGASRVDRYVWQGGHAVRSVLYTHPAGERPLTWDITPVPTAVLP